MKAMKRRSFLAPLTALAVSAGLLAPASAEQPSTARRNQPIQVNVDSPQPARPVQFSAVQAASDIASIRDIYGFAVRLPKDVESFSASYHLRDLWLGLANSKWANTLLNLPPVKEDRDIQKFIQGWNSPKAQHVKSLVDGIFGEEVIIAAPAGFSDKLKPLLDAYMQFVEVYMQHAFLALMGGKQMTPHDTQAMLQNAAPELIPAFAKADVPPILVIAKAGKARGVIDEAAAKLLSLVGTELPPAFEAGQFKVADKYEFKSITVVAKKLIAAYQEEKFKLQLRELMGDEAKAKEVMDLLMTKKVELAWGWVDDYLVVSIGADHSHVKLAASDAESALAVAEIAARATQYAVKKPTGISYISKAMFDKFAAKLEFADAFASVAEELRGILKPEAITGMKADVKRLEGRAQSIFTPVYDTQVGVEWWEGGLHCESFGGARNAMLDSSKPLIFSGLVSPTTLLLANGRSSATSKLAVDFLEEGVATVWSWYEKYGRTMVPENQRQGAAMIEATAIPLIKQAWGSIRLLGKALGDESAFVVDLNGTMPKLPDMPPFLADGKAPRIAYVAELKDRAALTESWKGFASIIKQITALLAENAPQTIPEPQMKKDGDLEVHFVPLPVDTGDLLPHIAISKDRWIISSSPSFSKELAAKPAGGGAPLGTQWTLSFTALWDFADKWLVVVDKNAEQMMGANDAKEFKQIRPIIDTALKLARSVQTAEAKIFEEAGKARMSLFLKVEDLK
jgi:hypothetical protein